MYSLSYLYQAMGDNEYADRCELAAFNALPVMTTSNQWARQYIVLANQPFSYSLTGDLPFFNVGPDGIVYDTGRAVSFHVVRTHKPDYSLLGILFGAISPEVFPAHIIMPGSFSFERFVNLCLESHYPCCTVNLPQGYPKFLSASFVRAGPDGLAHALLMPAHVSTTLSSRTAVNVTCDTDYPFDNTLNYTITTSAPFNFHIRLPSWSSPHHTVLILNDIPQSIAPDSHTGMISLGIPAGSNSIVYTLAPILRIVPRANDTVAIYHGCLLYTSPSPRDATLSRMPSSA